MGNSNQTVLEQYWPLFSMWRQISRTIMFEKKLLKILCYALKGLISSLEEWRFNIEVFLVHLLAWGIVEYLENLQIFKYPLEWSESLLELIIANNVLSIFYMYNLTGLMTSITDNFQLPDFSRWHLELHRTYTTANVQSPFKAGNKGALEALKCYWWTAGLLIQMEYRLWPVSTSVTLHVF